MHLDIYSDVIFLDDAVYGDGVFSWDISSCNEELSENSFNEIPEDYTEFLEKANGYMWSECEFYGTLSLYNSITDIFINDIVSANLEFKDSFSDENRLLLIGMRDGSYVLYNSDSETYDVCDTSELSVENSYDSFLEFLEDSIPMNN